ncbi:MAG TPA: hypothetical protein VGN95_06550 [Pyrinomonadaceae bacterium]|jgi:hypothetical protein|nr:hypothetical protein [Pyrinomonadaceae bacterium]
MSDEQEQSLFTHHSSLITHHLIYGTRNSTPVFGLWGICSRDGCFLPGMWQTIEGKLGQC